MASIEIEALRGVDAVRRRPGMYIGDDVHALLWAALLDALLLRWHARRAS